MARDLKIWKSIPSVTPKILDTWRRNHLKAGIAGLAGKYGRHRKGKGIIEQNPEVRDYIVGLLTSKPHVDCAQIIAGLRARFGAAGVRLPCLRALQFWVKAWKLENGADFEAITDPDRVRSTRGVAFASASADVVALNDRWEMDSTSADVMCTDGRQALVGVIDVWSRRAKLLVAPTSRALAITALMKRAILDWGVPVSVKFDNGQDYVARHTMGALADLGIAFIPCPPYAPRKSPTSSGS